MKQYIRTIGGKIIDTTNKIIEESRMGDFWIRSKHSNISKRVGIITHQADTIEELCDEYVVVDKEDNCHHLTLKIELYDTIDYEIYGANWTDKGLIYVAKMNEKRELEVKYEV